LALVCIGNNKQKPLAILQAYDKIGALATISDAFAKRQMAGKRALTPLHQKHTATTAAAIQNF